MQVTFEKELLISLVKHRADAKNKKKTTKERKKEEKKVTCDECITYRQNVFLTEYAQFSKQSFLFFFQICFRFSVAD